MFTLSIIKRDTKVSTKQLQADGIVPGVLYGPKVDSLPISIDAAELLRVWKETGESSIIVAKEGDDSHDVLVHDMQFDPVNGDIRHVDLYAIERGKKITVHVPLTFIGEAPGEKAGGVVIKTLQEIEIESMPRDLPQHIDIDISSLEIGGKIDASDIPAIEGVEILANDDETIISIVEAKEEEIPEEAPSIDDIEVEGEKKEENSEETPKEE
jgi:large subunit ribosomal protein L25